MGAKLLPGSRRGQVCPVLVGRDDLLALADRRLTAAGGGTGQLLFLAGEAGIGKTRLLTEITGRAHEHGFSVVGAGAFPRGAEAAGGLLAELAADLQRPAAGSTGGNKAAIGRRITQRLRDGGDGDAHRQHRLLITDLADAVILLGSEPGPVLLALEDLHWCDDLTLEVLDRVARHIATVPILVVGTYRSDELYPRVPMRTWRAPLLTLRLAEEVRLARLTPEDTAAMAAAITDTVLPTAVTGAVFARSDGIPLHVEEFLASVSGTGIVAGVPDTLADAVLARAQLLSTPARALAGAASVIGRSFDLDLLTAITGDAPQDIDGGLRELADRFFVQPNADRATYDFRHALIRDALYADLTPHLRRDLHARAAEAAAAAGFADAFISDQYERAHRPAVAYRHALAGAAAAVALSAHREAVQLYRRAQRTTPLDATDMERVDLLVALADELAAIDDNTAAAAAYTEAYALCHRLGNPVAAAALVPSLVAVRHLLGAGLDERTGQLQEALCMVQSSDDKEIRARIHAALSAAYMLDRRLDEAIEHGEHAQSIGLDAIRWHLDTTLGSVLLFAGRMDEGWRLIEHAVTDATEAGIEAEAARGYRMLGSSASVLVEYQLGLRWLRAGIEYAERTERFNDRHYMTAHLAHVLWAIGDWPAADREARHAFADGRGGITTQITALHVLGYLALGRGDWTAAEQHLTEAAGFGTQMRELQRISPAWWGLAETALHRGRSDESIKWCERGYAVSVSVRDAAYLFPYVLTGTRAYLAADNLTGARDWVGRTTDLLRQRGIPGTLGAVEHARGLLHLHEGQTGKAREALDRAAAFWDQRQRFWEGTQARLDQARCAHRSRRPADAAGLIREARARAVAAGAGVLVEVAEQLATARSTHGGTDAADNLTAREIEVAKLVATGATNRQIAGALSIAPKTVAAHVEHILTKLGASRRTQIATWAATRSPGASPRTDPSE